MTLKENFQDGEVLSAQSINDTNHAVNELTANALGPILTIDASGNIHLDSPLPVAEGGTGATSGASACSALGAVKKSGDTMSGTLDVPYVRISPTVTTGWPSLALCKGTTSDSLGGVQLNPHTNQLCLNQEALDSNFSERYTLPAPPSSLAADKWYFLLTSKHPVTLAQGGLGRSFASEDELKTYLKSLLGL